MSITPAANFVTGAAGVVDNRWQISNLPLVSTIPAANFSSCGKRGTAEKATRVQQEGAGGGLQAPAAGLPDLFRHRLWHRLPVDGGVPPRVLRTVCAALLRICHQEKGDNLPRILVRL